jgi:hypothetical protein
LADLHEILQLAFGWSGFYLYEFRIHGRTFEEERSVCLADLQLHPGERFRYCYNFFVFWECDVRLEAILPRQGELTHPRCVGCRHPAPDEDHGGAWGYQQLQDHYKFAPLEAASLPGFVESTVNQVVSKRFVKKQQMQWTPRGAHLLLQTRTKVLNGDLEQTFRGWYPAFRHDAEGLAA